MKTTLFTLISIILLICSGKPVVLAQRAKTDTTLNLASLKAVNLHDFASFKKSVMPLIATMGAKKIVGLGEGTHGTAEFYKIRFWISRILIEEKGFNHIAFENDYSDSWLLNNELGTTNNISALMKQYMLKIWQNQETEKMLTWVKGYNSKHQNKVSIDGIDYVYIMPDVKMLRRLLTKTSAANYLDSLGSISKAAKYQDSCWDGENKASFKVDGKFFDKNGYDGYLAADKLDLTLQSSSLSAETKKYCHLALMNVKEAFAPFYDDVMKKPEASRDSLMAYNTSLIMKDTNDKMIIWAHDAHVAKTGIYNNEVGGTGGMILKMFPNNYYVLGTGTARGTFSATKELHDTYTNPMAAYKLDKPIANSWDSIFNRINKPAFWFIPAQINPGNATKTFRVIGYGPDSGPKSYDSVNLNKMFDAFIFIKDTHAGTALK